MSGLESKRRSCLGVSSCLVVSVAAIVIALAAADGNSAEEQAKVFDKNKR